MNEIEQFNLALDQLLGIAPGQPSVEMAPLQAASALAALDLDSEAAPPPALRARWAQKTTQRKNKMNSTLRFAAISALILLVLAAVLLTVPGTVQALQNFFRYIPGFGIVDTSVAIRKLAEPVSLTREGVTVLVQDATLTGDSTLMRVTVSGISATLYPPADEIVRPDALCDAPVYLRLPDGKTIALDVSVAGNAFHYRGPAVGEASYQNDWRLLPVPVGVDRATLVMPCILSLKHAAGPENWELPLRFAPQVADGALIPPTASSTPKATETAPVQTASPTRIIPSLTPSKTPFIRVLAEPASQTIDGVTLTVIKATLDDDVTLIEVRASGKAGRAYPTDDSNFAQCAPLGQLLLPDGTHTDHYTRPDADGLYTATSPEILSFWFLPKNVNTATLLLSCVPGWKFSASPRDWAIPLRFVPLESRPTASPTATLTVAPSKTPFIRILVEPVQQTRNGVTVNVTKATLDDDATRMEIIFSGAPKGAINNSLDTSEICMEFPFLLLPDGTHTNYHVPQSADGWIEALDDTSYSFWFLPKDVNNVTLVIPCILHWKNGSAPENWEIPLRFVPLGSKPSASATPKAPVVEPASAAKQLTQCEKDCSNPRWSADGRFIVYQTGNAASLHVMDWDGKNDHLLVAGSNQSVWSPTGAQLAIINGANLFVVNADGSGLRTLSEKAGYWEAPVWSPDGQQIAFVASQGEQYLLSTIAVDGTGLRSRYLSHRDAVIIDETINELTWLPDGSKLAFSSHISRAADPWVFELRLLDMKDNALQNLYHFDDELQFSLLGFLPDGRHAYMLDYHKPEQVLYQLNTDGSGVTQLATLPEGHQGLKISPDKKSLVYISSDGNLEMMQLDGTASRTLVKDIAHTVDHWSLESIHIAFAPDGKRIVFTGQDQFLYIVDVDGSHLQKIAQGDLPVWSPDGMQLAFVAQGAGDGVTQIYVEDLPQ